MKWLESSDGPLSELEQVDIWEQKTQPDFTDKKELGLAGYRREYLDIREIGRTEEQKELHAW
jgi:hypothetical protein